MRYVEATFDFTAADVGQLTFAAGDVIQVTSEGSPGEWWAGSLNGVEGYFPSNYCSEPYDEGVFEEASPPAAPPTLRAAHPRCETS